MKQKCAKLARGYAPANMVGLKKEIASTQRLVGTFVQMMSRFAGEFGQQHDT